MAQPAPDLPVAARKALDELAQTPVKLLVVGGIGTGKSTLLGAVRDALRNAGIAALTACPTAAYPTAELPADAALVIDDAHLRTGPELGRLAELAMNPHTTVVVATEPRNHDTNLRALTTAIERQRPRVALGPLTAEEVSGVVGEFTGSVPPDALVATVLEETAGIPFLVRAAATREPRAAFFALIDRLRCLDEAELAALLIASLGPDLGAVDIAAALGRTADEGLALIDRARGTGLVEPSYSPKFERTVHGAVAQIVGNARHHDIEAALLRSQLEMATLSPGLAVRLAEHGMRDVQLAENLRTQAHAVRSDVAAAARLYRAAVDAGAIELRSRLADALALSNSCATAATQADDLLGSDDPAERADAVRVAASLAANDGNYAQAAELFSWLGPYPDATVGVAAALVLTGIGNLEQARLALAPRDPAPPTAAARAARSLADGLLLTIESDYPAGATKLGQAIATEPTARHTMPDSTAALVTLAALHGGDPVRARTVIGRAVREPTAALFEHRHVILQAWIKMQEGQLSAAGADIAVLSPTELHRRDALWLAALRTAIARRTGDFGALQKHWFTAVDALAEYSIDLFSLLPVGELWMASARIGQPNRLATVLPQAFALLRSLGDPVAWSAPLHWAGVHAGIIANNPTAVAPHGQALAAAAGSNPFAKVLATGGRTWLRVLANQVDPDEVTAAARGLSEFGLTADATRLAGQAALQATDPKVSGLMLQVARDLKLATPDQVDTGPPENTPAATASGTELRGTRPMRSALSERERQVAELLLLGMPYRDIGSQLFISAKTVEHHVARIRRRLGADSRSEMLSMLRAILATNDSASAER